MFQPGTQASLFVRYLLIYAAVYPIPKNGLFRNLSNSLDCRCAVVTPTLIKRTCEECFTTILTPQQIAAFLAFTDIPSIADQCTLSEQAGLAEALFRNLLSIVGITGTTQDDLIACLKNAGIVFGP